MFHGVSNGGYATTWAWMAKHSASAAAEAPRPRWQVVHGELLGLAKRRAALDAEEARWIREAEDLLIWRELGMVSLVDYLERVLGYAPRTSQYRIRVARALADLPDLTDALSQGELSFSAVKELVRVATLTTESAWRAAAAGKNIRQIEELCAGHRRGDLPDDPAEPDARLHSVLFSEVTGAAYALFRQAQQKLTTDHGSYMSESDVLAALASAVLGSGSDSEHTGRATYQIGYNVCRICKHATQQGGGVSVPVTPAALEQALCFAQHIGDIDSNVPERAAQDIPPATVRAVWARDKGVCQTPGCRSCVGLEIHHIIPRDDGGGHEMSNLTLRCFACHTARHEGKLRITGTAPDKIITEYVVRFDEPLPAVPQTLPSRYDLEVMRTEAVSAMRGLGWSPGIAKSVVSTALAELGATATIETVLRAAVARTPRPSGS